MGNRHAIGRLRIGIVVGSVAVVMGFLPLRGSVPMANGATSCPKSIDGYSMTADQRAACGIQTYPLLSTIPLADGGTSYQYSAVGMPLWINVPPPGFDASKASAPAKEEYGIPDPPEGYAATWPTLIANMLFVRPPNMLLSVPIRASEVRDPHWAGFVATGGGYNNAFNIYTEPTSHSGCPNGMLTIWAGLGGYNQSDDNLDQNGTLMDVPGYSLHHGFLEVIGHNYDSSMIAVPFSASPGHTVYTETVYSGNNNLSFWWYDSYTGWTLTTHATSTRHSQQTAEAILERPWVKANADFSDLDTFGQIGLDGLANGVSIGDFSHDKVQMYSDNLQRELAFTSALSADKEHFSETWDACS